jgi:hypothetical protein
MALPEREGQFAGSLPLVDRAGRAPLWEASYNSSCIEAIVDDLRRAELAGILVELDAIAVCRRQT